MKTLIFILSLTSTAFCERTVTLAWDPQNDAQNFIVRIGELELSRIAGNVFEVTIVIPDKATTISVSALSDSLESERSLITVPAAPAKPKNLKVTKLVKVVVSTSTP